jgi:hypothetical protein
MRHVVKYTWPVVISIRKKTKGSWVPTSTIGLGRQKNWGQGQRHGQKTVPTTGESGLVTISVLVLEEVPELLSGGCLILSRVCCWG